MCCENGIFQAPLYYMVSPFFSLSFSSSFLSTRLYTNYSGRLHIRGFIVYMFGVNHVYACCGEEIAFLVAYRVESIIVSILCSYALKCVRFITGTWVRRLHERFTRQQCCQRFHLTRYFFQSFSEMKNVSLKRVSRMALATASSKMHVAGEN